MSAETPSELELLRAKARLHQLEFRQSSDELLSAASAISAIRNLQSFKPLLPLAGAGASLTLLLLLLRRHRVSPFLIALGVIVDAFRLAVVSGIFGDTDQAKERQELGEPAEALTHADERGNPDPRQKSNGAMSAADHRH